MTREKIIMHLRKMSQYDREEIDGANDAIFMLFGSIPTKILIDSENYLSVSCAAADFDGDQLTKISKIKDEEALDKKLMYGINLVRESAGLGKLIELPNSIHVDQENLSLDAK